MTTFSRRTVLRSGAALAVSRTGFLRTSSTWAQTNPVPEVQALLFDVFGTVVDWRNGVGREAEKVLKPLGYSFDWLAFADAWRAQYQPGMDEIRTGGQPFVKLDIIHRRMLDKIKPRFGLEKLDEATQAEPTFSAECDRIGPLYTTVPALAAAAPPVDLPSGVCRRVWHSVKL
jgi:hypothetical protein